MRTILLITAFFLLLGCTAGPIADNETPPPASPPPAQPPSVQPPPAATPPAPLPPPEPPPVSGNITDNQSNQTNQTNQTAPKGLLFGNGKYLLVLDDVSVIPSSQEPCGIFSLRNATDFSTYEKMFICPPDSQEWRSPDDHVYRIKVIKVAAGYSGGGNFVEVIIYG